MIIDTNRRFAVVLVDLETNVNENLDRENLAPALSGVIGEIGKVHNLAVYEQMKDEALSAVVGFALKDTLNSNGVQKEIALGNHIPPYISVITDGGIINQVEIETDLEEAIRAMNSSLYECFDREKDDGRIFDSNNQEVYSFPDEVASEAADRDWSEEQYVEFAVKLWKGEFIETDDYLAEIMTEFEKQFEA